MSARFIQYGFTAGVVTEGLWGQTILQKYGYGLARCENYMVSKLGGLISRSGYVFCDAAPMQVGEAYKFFGFNFAKSTNNTAAILVVPDKIYFAQDGAWQLDDGVAVTQVTTGTYATITCSSAHGLVSGDYIQFTGANVPAQLYGQTCRVVSVTSSTVAVVSSIVGVGNLDDWAGTGLTGVTVHRLYSVDTPWDSDAIAALHLYQTRDEVRICSPVTAPHSLLREADGTWSLTEISFVHTMSPPDNLRMLDVSNTGQAGVVFAVTAVNAAGEESLPATVIIRDIRNYYNDDAEWIKIAWDHVPDAVYYIVYRSLLTRGERMNKGAALGYCARVYGNTFTDNNYLPDFTKTPPRENNPFAPGRINYIDVTNSGSGYNYDQFLLIVTDPDGSGASLEAIYDDDLNGFIAAITISGGAGYTNPTITPVFQGETATATATVAAGAVTAGTITDGGQYYSSTPAVTITGDGTGATATAVRTGDVITGITITNGGTGYTTATITIAPPTTPAGSGFTATADIAPLDGVYPQVSASFGQRAIYAATLNEPLGLWASQIGRIYNMSFSDVVAADESYNFSLDSTIMGTIKHIVGSVAGILVFSDIGIWLLTGSKTAPTATDIDAIPQTSVGSNALVPIIIDNDILYMELYNQTIRHLKFNDYSRNFGGQDVTLLAEDLIAASQEYLSWTYLHYPYKVINAVAIEGWMLSGTVEREQEVFAWWKQTTEGNFLANITLSENARPIEYVLVERNWNSEKIVTLEYQHNRRDSTRWVHCGLDQSVELPKTRGTVTLVYSNGAITATAPFFSAGDVGKYLLIDKGIARITAYTSSTVVSINIIDPIYNWVTENLRVYARAGAGTWFMTEEVTEITLPYNMRPGQVTAYLNGEVDHNYAEVDGVVTLTSPAHVGWVGLPYTCTAVSLPLQVNGAIIEESVKKILSGGLRLYDTRGLQVGTSFDDLYPIEEAYHEVESTEKVLTSGIEKVHVSSEWDESIALYMVCTDPVPIHITALVIHAEIGDEI